MSAAGLNTPNSAISYSRMDEPPQFGPDEKPTPDQFRDLALQLLREMAAYDPQAAESLRRLGLGPERRKRVA